ncbi:MAG TPA: AAA family ATPase [Acidimicrobiales bacterium]|nr:AAA family ATPase [Acidimicrobiales bacterium]
MAAAVPLVQMAGRPGVGKSSIARGVAAAMNAVVLDNDVIKSTLLDSGVDWDASAKAAWDLVYALAHEVLDEGHSLILDNPSHYPSVPVRGQEVAAQHGACYAMVECICADDAEVARRMSERRRLRSHMAGFGEWSPEGLGPSAAVRTGPTTSCRKPSPSSVGSSDDRVAASARWEGFEPPTF